MSNLKKLWDKACRRHLTTAEPYAYFQIDPIIIWAAWHVERSHSKFSQTSWTIRKPNQRPAIHSPSSKHVQRDWVWYCNLKRGKKWTKTTNRVDQRVYLLVEDPRSFPYCVWNEFWRQSQGNQGLILAIAWFSFFSKYNCDRKKRSETEGERRTERGGAY
jgi:hypothetical protein